MANNNVQLVRNLIFNGDIVRTTRMQDGACTADEFLHEIEARITQENWRDADGVDDDAAIMQRVIPALRLAAHTWFHTTLEGDLEEADYNAAKTTWTIFQRHFKTQYRIPTDRAYIVINDLTMQRPDEDARSFCQRIMNGMRPTLRDHTKFLNENPPTLPAYNGEHLDNYNALTAPGAAAQLNRATILDYGAHVTRNSFKAFERTFTHYFAKRGILQGLRIPVVRDRVAAQYEAEPNMPFADFKAFVINTEETVRKAQHKAPAAAAHAVSDNAGPEPATVSEAEYYGVAPVGTKPKAKPAAGRGRGSGLRGRGRGGRGGGTGRGGLSAATFDYNAGPQHGAPLWCNYCKRWCMHEEPDCKNKRRDAAAKAAFRPSTAAAAVSEDNTSNAVSSVAAVDAGPLNTTGSWM